MNPQLLKSRNMGIYSQLDLDCSCIIKFYFGGKTILNASSKCTTHKTQVYYICRVCPLEFFGRGAKSALKEHQWSHTN